MSDSRDFSSSRSSWGADGVGQGSRPEVLRRRDTENRRRGGNLVGPGPGANWIKNAMNCGRFLSCGSGEFFRAGTNFTSGLDQLSLRRTPDPEFYPSNASLIITIIRLDDVRKHQEKHPDRRSRKQTCVYVARKLVSSPESCHFARNPSVTVRKSRPEIRISCSHRHHSAVCFVSTSFQDVRCDTTLLARTCRD